jgi:hypothetical protein
MQNIGASVDIARGIYSQCAAIGGIMLAACYEKPSPDPEAAAAAITAFHAWILAGKSEQGVVEGFPDVYTARLYVAGLFSNECGDGDDDLFCNLLNYGPFAEDQETFIACRNAIDAINASFREVGPFFSANHVPPTIIGHGVTAISVPFHHFISFQCLPSFHSSILTFFIP